MQQISKRFPGVLACDEVNISLFPGEILAIIGENGAGKSTLMNILYGLYQPDEGQIFIKGEAVKILNPNQAIAHGIGMVHQHFMLVNPFTVAENIVLGAEPRRSIFLNFDQARKIVSEVSNRYGLKVKPDARIEQLPVGVQQRVEILRILYRGAEIIILDEPTAVLNPQEVRELYTIMHNLTAQGKSIIFISHKLNEVLAISQRVTVMRRGRVMGNVATKDTSPPELANLMVGRPVLLQVEKGTARPGKYILEVRDLVAKNYAGDRVLDAVNFEVKSGEILGIAGVEGNGQTELVEVLTGLRRAVSGKILLRGTDITALTPRKIKEQKIGHIPEDRQKRGLELDFTVQENLIFGYHYKSPFARGKFLNLEVISNHADRLIKEFDIRTPGSETTTRSLSGGNQQKVILAREFYEEPELLIAAQPSRGVDIGAIEFIHRRLVEHRDAGKAVLLISPDLAEILSLSDRIAVIYEGRIMGIVDTNLVTEEQLGLMMAGIRAEQSAGCAFQVESGNE
ncbi:MAG: Galactose/methyl galactoside import ATP-binding protein MglA [candidate division WS2 bacterium]|uniref:Galactose/methyl galactoside import ATP-binding protein MglA n=1 Tax=Psychracetigena formicireducens TaxID=2986056 RepID=A0A9E2F6H1_PSYF1|nr:Galactose/methyl galactoside import ATP-binding protein MglA [Candidatus Psychracetigena formicireducens]